MTRTTRANPDETRFFFPFSNVVFVLWPPFLFHHLLYNQLLLTAAERKGEWGTLSLEAGLRRGWSGWSPVSVGGDSGLAKRRRRLGKKKEGLSSFGQPGRWLREGWRKSWLSSLLLLDGTPSRTRVKKEGKRMSFIFQFLILSQAW